MIIIYDIGVRDQWDQCINLVKSIKGILSSSVDIILVDTSIKPRSAGKDEAKIVANDLRAKYFEASAETGCYVEDIFLEAAKLGKKRIDSIQSA